MSAKNLFNDQAIGIKMKAFIGLFTNSNIICAGLQWTKFVFKVCFLKLIILCFLCCLTWRNTEIFQTSNNSWSTSFSFSWYHHSSDGDALWSYKKRNTHKHLLVRSTPVSVSAAWRIKGGLVSNNEQRDPNSPEGNTRSQRGAGSCRSVKYPEEEEAEMGRWGIECKTFSQRQHAAKQSVSYTLHLRYMGK